MFDEYGVDFVIIVAAAQTRSWFLGDVIAMRIFCACALYSRKVNVHWATYINVERNVEPMYVCKPLYGRVTRSSSLRS